MWECEWKHIREDKPVIVKLMSPCTRPVHLKPTGLFGATPNAYKLYYNAKKGEKFRYLDFTT